MITTTFGLILNVMFCLNLYNIPNNSKYNLLQKEKYVAIVEEYGISSINIKTDKNITVICLDVIKLTYNKILKNYKSAKVLKITIWEYG